MNNYKITMENLRGDEVRDKPYGEGTAINPYKISSAENLVYLAEHEEMWTDKHFLQTNNIDMDGINWSVAISLDGCNYNGNNYYVKNLNIIQDVHSFGLFAFVTMSVISNLSIQDSSFIGNSIHDSTFGFISVAINTNVEIINCSVSNCTINTNGSSSYAGCIVGFNVSSKVSYCTSYNNTISGNGGIGGIAGFSQDGEIFACVSKNNEINNIDSYNAGSAGGIVGWNHYYSVIANCYSLNNVITASSSLSLNDIFLGGVAGWTDSTSFEIQDWSNSTIINSTTAGNVYIGGVNGVNLNINSLSNTSYWDSESTGILISDSLNPSGISANPITTAQLAQQSTFTDWDFTDIWEMGAYYPKLRFEAFVIEKETELFEYPFPYKILKGTTQYDPFSYISYDYMISTSRKAEFQAFINDYFDDENFNFVNTLTRVGYRKDLYDNDITLYNHFYYSTEDDEDEFVRIELEDNTIKYEVGSTVVDKYGEVRTVSSREIVSEGISTIMCRIYEITDSGERIVYSGLIDKRETKFDGKKLSVSLIDMMGLYVELSEKYNVVISNFQNSGFNAISSISKIKEFILFLNNNLNINNNYLPNIEEVLTNTEYTDIITEISPSESRLLSTRNVPISLHNEGSGYDYFIFYLQVLASFDDYNNISLSQVDYSTISSNDDIEFNPLAYYEDSSMMLNVSDLRLYRNEYEYYNNQLTKRFFDTYREKYGVILNIRMGVHSKPSGNKLYIYPNMGILTEDSYSGYRVAFSKYNKNDIKSVSVSMDVGDYWEVNRYGDYSGIYQDVKTMLEDEDVLSAIDDELAILKDEINAKLNNRVILLHCAEEPTPSENFDYSNYISIYDDPDDNDYNSIVKIESQDRISTDNTLIDYKLTCNSTLSLTNTYIDTLPIYADTYSLYDITKLFSLTCYNKILTKDTGEMYFDKESYSENNGYIYIDKADIVNNYSQESMISDEESFDILDSVYVGTKYIKEAYKRLETSTKENYKKLYENNNMKVSFNLRNYEYEIKSNLTTVIDTREIEPKDVIRIMDNGYVKIEVFVTSVKFINNNTEIQLDGITLPIRTASLR